VLATLKERKLETKSSYSIVYSSCSAVVIGSDCVDVLRDSPCVRIRKWETCLILKEDRSRLIAGVRLAGAPATKTAILLGISRATDPKVTLAYTNDRKTTSAKRNSRRKSTFTERDRHTL
jgi:hypothetical protein